MRTSAISTHDQRQQRLEEPGREDGLLEQRAVDRDRRPALRPHEQLERPGLRLAAPEPLDGADPDLREAGHPGLDHDAGRLDVELELAVGVGALELGVQARVAAVVDGEVVGPGARSTRRPRRQLRERVGERADGDRPLLDRRPGRVLAAIAPAARTGRTPARVEAARGGRRTSLAVPSAPGNSDRTAGSAVAQPAASPRTSSVNSSTTLPVFRTRTSALTSCPGSTARAGVTRVTEAPTGESVAACRAGEQAAGACAGSPLVPVRGARPAAR